MIDWVSCNFPYRGGQCAEHFLTYDPMTGAIFPAYAKAVPVEGSWSSKLQVMATGSRMYLSGNPTKFLSGQNVFGSNETGCGALAIA